MTLNVHFRQKGKMELTWSGTISSRIVPGITATKTARGSESKERIRHRPPLRRQLSARAGEHHHRHPPLQADSRALLWPDTMTLGLRRKGAAASPSRAIVLIRDGPDARVPFHRRPLLRQSHPVHVGMLLRDPSLPRRTSSARRRSHARISLRWTGKRRRETYKK